MATSGTAGASRPKPLVGVNVVELTTTVAGPAAGAMLCDYGATVVKVEPSAGDPFRDILGAIGASKMSSLGKSPYFYCINRGKMSVVLDLKTASGRAGLGALLTEADVFVTNYRQPPLEKLGLDAASLSRRFPRLVVCAMTGYGRRGPDASLPGYDIGVFYARSGLASAFHPTHPKYGDPSQPFPPSLPPGAGDMVTSMAAVTGILAALADQRCTGRGRVVETSLLRAGLWTNMWALQATLVAKNQRAFLPRGRQHRFNPVMNSYRGRDGRVFWLLGMEAQRHFPGLAKAVGKGSEWLAKGHAFNTTGGRARNATALVAELDELFAQHPMAHWAARFDEHDVWWQPVQTSDEVVKNEQVLQNGGVVDLGLSEQDVREGTTAIRSLNNPVDFDGVHDTHRPPVPALGQHSVADALQALRANATTAAATNSSGKARL